MNRARAVLVGVLIFLGALFALTANSAVWANRTVFDTDNFVATANRVLDDDEVQQQLATRLSVALVERGDVNDRLQEVLPEDQQRLAPILTNAARNLAYDIVLRLLQNDAFRAGLDTSLRLVHQQVMKIIQDEGAVVVKDDQVVLDLKVVLQRAADELNIDPNLKVELPEDAGQIVLVKDAQTASAVQRILSLHDTITWLVIGLTVAMFGLAILVARDRRATLRTVGVVIGAVGLLAAILLVPLRPIAASFADNKDAARAAWDAFFLSYQLQSVLVSLLGVGIAVVAVLLGDSELARALRGRVRRTPDKDAPDLGEAIRNSAVALRVFGLAVGALVLVAWPDPSTRVYTTTFLLLGVYFATLWVISDRSETAAAIRARIAGSGGQAGPSRLNDTPVGRHANQLRLLGIVAAIVAFLLVPDLGIGALAAIVAMTLAYLALVDWLATRQA